MARAEGQPSSESLTKSLKQEEHKPDEALLAELRQKMRLHPHYFAQRKCPEKYEQVKRIEDRIAKLAQLNEKVEVYFFYVGVIYGDGELALSSIFDDAWNQIDLPISEVAAVRRARIPVIEKKNLVNLIFEVVNEPGRFLEKNTLSKEELASRQKMVKQYYNPDTTEPKYDAEGNPVVEEPPAEDKPAENDTDESAGKSLAPFVFFASEKDLLTQEQLL